MVHGCALKTIKFLFYCKIPWESKISFLNYFVFNNFTILFYRLSISKYHIALFFIKKLSEVK